MKKELVIHAEIIEKDGKQGVRYFMNSHGLMPLETIGILEHIKRKEMQNREVR